MKPKILITGTAGFIGFHLADKLVKEGYAVVGLDVINDYYNIRLKHDRLKEHGIVIDAHESEALYQSTIYKNYRFLKADLADHDNVVEFMVKESFDYVINLAAQAGVRYSLENPRAYTHSNIDGFLSVLEGCRHSGVKHLIYASTSSAYGLNKQMPLREDSPTEHPMALYAATKKANEMMAHSYSHLFAIPTTGLRFFTVYGPWGRPDMALFLFASAIERGEPLNVFNHGNMIRDFTYVGDIVESISRLIPKPPVRNPEWDGYQPKSNYSSAPYQIFNIGNGSPVKLMDYINALEKAIGRKAKYNLMDIQPGDVPATHASTVELEKYIDFRPNTSIAQGIENFYRWYSNYWR